MNEKDVDDNAVYQVVQAAYDRIGSKAPHQQQMGPRGRIRTRKPKLCQRELELSFAHSL